jgi:hypothetical protein
MDYSFLVGVKRMEQTNATRTEDHESEQMQQQTQQQQQQHKKRITSNSSFFKRNGGGLFSSNGEFVFYFGIIDILTSYGWVKYFENSLKSLLYEENTISAVNPHLYRSRFEFFLSKHCFENNTL